MCLSKSESSLPQYILLTSNVIHKKDKDIKYVQTNQDDFDKYYAYNILK